MDQTSTAEIFISGPLTSGSVETTISKLLNIRSGSWSVKLDSFSFFTGTSSLAKDIQLAIGCNWVEGPYVLQGRDTYAPSVLHLVEIKAGLGNTKSFGHSFVPKWSKITNPTEKCSVSFKILSLEEKDGKIRFPTEIDLEGYMCCVCSVKKVR